MLLKSLALCAAVALLLTGCRGPDPNVSGTVTYEGAPVAKGQITFTPVDGKGPVAGAEIIAGQYQIATLIAGQKQVQITATVDGGPALSSADMAAAAASGKAPPAPQVLIPPGAVGNGKMIEIKPGEQKLDFPLTKPAGR